MTRTEIKQAADTARNGLPKHIHRSVVIIAADELITKLEAENLELKAARIAYASEFSSDGYGDPDVGSIHQNIRKLKADKAKLREALVSVAAYPGVDKYLGLQITAAMSKALKDTSDE